MGRGSPGTLETCAAKAERAAGLGRRELAAARRRAAARTSSAGGGLKSSLKLGASKRGALNSGSLGLGMVSLAFTLSASTWGGQGRAGSGSGQVGVVRARVLVDVCVGEGGKQLMLYICSRGGWRQGWQPRPATHIQAGQADLGKLNLGQLRRLHASHTYSHVHREQGLLGPMPQR